MLGVLSTLGFVQGLQAMQQECGRGSRAAGRFSKVVRELLKTKSVLYCVFAFYKRVFVNIPRGSELFLHGLNKCPSSVDAQQVLN